MFCCRCDAPSFPLTNAQGTALLLVSLFMSLLDWQLLSQTTQTSSFCLALLTGSYGMRHMTDTRDPQSPDEDASLAFHSSAQMLLLNI